MSDNIRSSGHAAHDFIAPGKRSDLTQGERDRLAECADAGVPWAIAEDLDNVLAAFEAKALSAVGICDCGAHKP